MRCLATAVFLFALSACAADPLTIPVVRTWKELAEAPEITLLPTPDGDSRGTIRVGIEAVEGPSGCRVLLYGLASDCIDSISERNRLGPLRIERKKAKSLCECLMKGSHQSGRALFTRGIHIDNETETIELRDGSRIVATATLKPTRVPFHEWRTLELIQDCSEGSRSATQLELTNSGDCAAYPKDAEFGEGIHITDERLISDERLPHLLTGDDRGEDEEQFENEIAVLLNEFDSEWYCDRIFADAKISQYGVRALPFLWKQRERISDGETRVRVGNLIERLSARGSLQMKDGLLLLRCDEGMDPTHENLLIRYWVNGKAQSPGGTGKSCEKLMEMAKIAGCNTIHIRLQLERARLGAKTGDRITVQVLYCPHGVERNEVLDEIHELRQMEASAPFITNKVEFVLGEAEASVNKQLEWNEDAASDGDLKR